jgi:Zn-dependent protease
LEALAAQAQAAMVRGDIDAARGFWQESLKLLPNESVQYRSIAAHIENLTAPPPKSSAAWKNAGIGSTLLFLLAKGKLLLFGLSKLSTLVSMLAYAGVYWALYGWQFAFGMVFSIYIHEMGHVLKLREYGIPASAPMFIPGLGAFIRMNALRITPIQDARVGLAGPIYGLAAAAFALAAGFFTQAKAWDAIAHFGAVINIFNLTPVWQLDGSRGFSSQSRKQRIVILVTAAMLWFVTKEVMLGVVTAGGVYRLFTKDAAEEPDNLGMLQFLGLLVALSLIAMWAARGAR